MTSWQIYVSGILLASLALAGCATSPTLPHPPASVAASEAERQKMFPPGDMMSIGIYYYPTSWPKQQWPRDIANIKKLNLEFVHMAEFDWAFLEPEEGKFDFSWLDQCVELCRRNGLKVVLCTPSPAPPVWLAKSHPEALMVDAVGRRMQHGTRQQGNWSSDVFRAYVGRVVAAMARHYAGNPAVWGWQLDNEPSHYGKDMDYSDESQTKFRAWLKARYTTIDNLNRDWGNAFWSQMYQNFDQIRLPNKLEVVAEVNPHQVLDSRRWFTEELADYLGYQANVLRQYVGHSQWVTTNYMGLSPFVNPFLTAKNFELTTFTMYPVHGNMNEGPLGFRMGSMVDLSYAYDFMRSINGRGGFMELQPGQVNWGDVNPQPYPGAIHMWIMRGFAQGMNILCSYRYREPLAGSEMYHYGFVGTDGVTPLPGGKEFAQASREIQMLRTVRDPAAHRPAEYAARQAAILFNPDNRWDIDNHPQTTRFDAMGHIYRQYRALKRLGAPVDIITESADFSKYPFLICPAYQLVDNQLVARWRDYAEAGGNLILTCRTGQKDRRGHLWEGPWAKPILDLIGAKIPFYDCLPGAVTGTVEANGHKYRWGSWGESLIPADGTEVLARYADQYYANNPCVITRKLGKGMVTYIGVDSLSGDLEDAIIRGVYTRAGVTIEDFPQGFAVDWRDGFWVATNFTDKEQPIPAADDARIFIGTRQLGPAGVAVWR